MRLTCEDIIDHQEYLYRLQTDRQDDAFYCDMVERWVNTFEPDYDTAQDLFRTTKELLKRIIEKDENNNDNPYL